MRRGYEIGGKHSSDPIGSDKPRGKSSYQRKSGRDDSGLTPTETHQKAQLMRQFQKLESGLGNSEAFLAGYARAFENPLCSKCETPIGRERSSIGFCGPCSPNEATTASQETP